MFLKKKGKYIQAWDRVAGRQVMIEHLGTLEQIVKIIREHKGKKAVNREQNDEENVGNSV